ncbi:MAG: HAD family hydrolase [Promethearchaeota archaeon]
MKKLRAILYDMDGTLVYFQINFILARKKAIKILQKAGIPKDKLSIKNSIRIMVSNAKEYFKEVLNLKPNKILEIISKVNKAVVKIELKAAKKAKPVKNVYKLLEFCKKNGIKQFILTYNTHKVAEITLKKAHLLHYIDEIYGRDDVESPKPKIKHLIPIIQKYDLKPDETILIGDNSTDIELGKNFGCLTIGVIANHNLNSIENADYKIEQDKIYEETIKILKQNFDL